jgi:hypothetical protein
MPLRNLFSLANQTKQRASRARSSHWSKRQLDGKDLWRACTLGEVYLLQGKVDEAAAQYQKVIDNNPNAAGDLRGTGEQAERICAALKLSPEDTAKVIAPFKLLD